MNAKGCSSAQCVAYTLLVVGVLWFHNVALVEGNEGNPRDIYLQLRTEYNTTGNGLDAIDCNWKDNIEGAWGTLSSLYFLAGTMGKLKHGLRLTNVTKLRIYLARVGYLKVPGSLVFLNTQDETLNLKGCGEGDDIQWRQQGERGLDGDFHQTGGSLRIQAPNAGNYINKFTCFKLGKCSHTFYVITRPLPEVVPGLQLRENVEMGKDSYELNCAVPYCSVKECKVGKTDTVANRRAYPPFQITWSLASRESEEYKGDEIFQGQDIPKNYTSGLEMLTELNKEKVQSELNITIQWERKIRKDRESPVNEKESYAVKNDNDEVWRDAFGEKTKGTVLNSRITIKKPDRSRHSGVYECIIEDANGVVSTPSRFRSGSREWKEYRGRTNVYVISTQLFMAVGLGVSIACCIGVGIIILACPKKMEYDDGTPYTKDELVAPAKKQEMAEEIVAEEHSSSHHTTMNASKKSMKEE